MKASEQKKRNWNEAVEATLKEFMTYDGVVENETDRRYIAFLIYRKVAYKSHNPFGKKI